MVLLLLWDNRPVCFNIRSGHRRNKNKAVTSGKWKQVKFICWLNPTQGVDSRAVVKEHFDPAKASFPGCLMGTLFPWYYTGYDHSKGFLNHFQLCKKEPEAQIFKMEMQSKFKHWNVLNKANKTHLLLYLCKTSLNHWNEAVSKGMRLHFLACWPRVQNALYHSLRLPVCF